MVKKISNTFASKFLTVLANFLLVVITSRALGSDGRAEISLFMTDFTMVLLFNGIIGGSAMAYFVPQKNLFTLASIAYLWSLPISVLGVATLQIFHPSAYALWLLGAILLQAFTTVHQMVLLGRNHLFAYNISTALQPLLNLVYVYFHFEWLGEKNMSIFVEGFLYSSLVAYFVSMAQTVSAFEKYTLANFRETALGMIRYGSGTYASTILQTFTYRVSYYVLFWFGMSHTLGEFSNGLALAEATWMISNSLSIVLYAYILNNPNEEEQKRMTIQLASLCFILTLMSLLLLAFVPSSLFVYVFGADFGDLSSYILLLLPGVVCLGVSTVFAHYFSAKGNYFVNNFKSVLGLITVLVALFVFIPILGSKGAAIATSLSYISSSSYLFYVYFKKTATPFSALFDLKGVFKILTKN